MFFKKAKKWLFKKRKVSLFLSNPQKMASIEQLRETLYVVKHFANVFLIYIGINLQTIKLILAQQRSF